MDNQITGVGYDKAFDGVDRCTNTLQTIDYEHHEIHSGSYYRAGYQKDVANAGTAILAITTPDSSKELHFRVIVDHELEATIKLYENPDSVSSGTAVTPRNANRNRPDSSVATVVTDPTIDVSNATLIGNQVLGSNKSSGGNADSQYEWILRRNTAYVVHVLNNTTSNNQVNIKCQWYEHTPKN